MRFARAVILTSLSLACGSPPTATQDEAAAVDRALGNLSSVRAELSLGAEDRLVARRVVADADGREHVHFDRLHRNLRVLGGDLIVHGDRQGAFLGVTATLRRAPNLPTPALTAATAELRALPAAGVPLSPPDTELLILAGGAEAPRLAYQVSWSWHRPDGLPSEPRVLIDAVSGKELARWDEVRTVRARGRSYLHGELELETDADAGGYFLTDTTRGGLSVVDMNGQTEGGAIFFDEDNLWGDATLNDRATVGVDAMYTATVAWDYFSQRHDHPGFDGRGTAPYIQVHYGRNLSNAFWYTPCSCLTLGDGQPGSTPFASLDIVGHELAHGVTVNLANLVYFGDSGGLNESTSDIFGVMVERFAQNPNDPADYRVGERLGGNGLRDMARPESDGRSAGCYGPGVAQLDAHYASGVGNRFFYLLSEGLSGTPPCGAGAPFQGIGPEDAAAIWYRALSVHMTSRTDYPGARAATERAAADLFGAGSRQARAVASAWTAVKVSPPAQ
jgi:Zn-dependent metalloprotease